MKQTAENERTNTLHALYGVLETGNAMSRCHAVRAIEQLRPDDAESGKRLIGLLRDPDPDVRMDSAVALGNLEIGEATRPLLDALRKDHDGDVRIQAVIALAKIRSRDAVQPLIECFKADGYPELDYPGDDMEFSPCWEVQNQAMEALGRIKDGRATQALIDVLESGQYDDLEERGFEVLARLDEAVAGAFLVRQLSHQSPRTRRRAARALGSWLGRISNGRDRPQDVLNALANALSDADAGVRIAAAQALAEFDDPEFIADMTKLLCDPKAEVRSATAAILGKLQGPEILEKLPPLLDEKDPMLRRSVVRILGQIGDARFRDPLIRLLDTKDEDLLLDVLRSLGQIGVTGPEVQLADILSSQRMHLAVRTQAAQALGKILRNGWPAISRETGEESEQQDDPILSARNVLAATVFDDNERVGCASLDALANAYPDESVAWLSDVLLGRPLMMVSNERQSSPPMPAGTMQERNAEDEEDIDLVVGDDPETSTLASIVVGLPGDVPVPDTDEVSSTDLPGNKRSIKPQIRVFAARLLGGIAPAGSLAVDALIDAFHEGDRALRRECILALGRIGDESALPVVFEALESKHPEVRLAAIDVMKGIHMPAGAEERIEALCRDTDPNLRCAAISTLGSGSVARDCFYRALDDDDQQVCRTALNKLSKATYSDGCRKRVLDLMLRFSGELRTEVGAALRRVGDLQGAARLQELLRQADQEELHWLCIDALSEFYAGTVSGSEV